MFVDLGGFWKAFGRHVRHFWGTAGFCDFCDPSNAKPLFLRVGGYRRLHFFGVLLEAVSRC